MKQSLPPGESVEGGTQNSYKTNFNIKIRPKKLQEYNQYSKKVSLAGGESLSYIDLLNDKDLEQINNHDGSKELEGGQPYEYQEEGTNLLIEMIDPYCNPYPTCIEHTSEAELTAGEILTSRDDHTQIQIDKRFN